MSTCINTIVLVSIDFISIGLSEFVTYRIDPPTSSLGWGSIVHWGDLVALDGDLSEQMLIDGVQVCFIKINDFKVLYFCKCYQLINLWWNDWTLLHESTLSVLVW